MWTRQIKSIPPFHWRKKENDQVQKPITGGHNMMTRWLEMLRWNEMGVWDRRGVSRWGQRHEGGDFRYSGQEMTLKQYLNPACNEIWGKNIWGRGNPEVGPSMASGGITKRPRRLLHSKWGQTVGNESERWAGAIAHRPWRPRSGLWVLFYLQWEAIGGFSAEGWYDWSYVCNNCSNGM